MQINVYEAKTKLSELLKRAEAGEDVVIARAGKPVAKLVPIKQRRQPREPGILKGHIWIAPDFDEPDEELIRLFEEGPVFPEDDPSSEKG